MQQKLFFETKRFNGMHACIYLQNLREVRANLTNGTNSLDSFIRDMAAEMHKRSLSLLIFFLSLSQTIGLGICFCGWGFFFPSKPVRDNIFFFFFNLRFLN